jgi:hypothetical protein
VSGLNHLLMIYNQRVFEAEIDQSMMIDIPLNLQEPNEV